MENSNHKEASVRSVNENPVLFADFQLVAKAVDQLRVNDCEVYAVYYHNSYWKQYDDYREPVSALGCENRASLVDCFVAVGKC